MGTGMKSYTMASASSVADVAASVVEGFLRSMPRTVDVINVEKMKEYQQLDVDLLWVSDTGERKVEVKGDRYGGTGNFFLETHSNEERGTPGCFMYTEADWVAYYFVDTRELYLLPTAATRQWFIGNMSQFKERRTTTPTSTGHYTTVGRLVPKARVMREVPKVHLRKFTLDESQAFMRSHGAPVKVPGYQGEGM